MIRDFDEQLIMMEIFFTSIKFKKNLSRASFNRKIWSNGIGSMVATRPVRAYAQRNSPRHNSAST